MAVRFRVQPAALANVFHNALTIAKEKPKESPQPLIYLRYTWDDEVNAGQLMAIGAGRYAAGLDWYDTEGSDQGYAEVRVLGVNPEKNDLVDDLAKLASKVRGTTTSKNAFVDVEIDHKRSILVTYGAELLGELADQDEWDLTMGNDGKPGIFEQVEDLVDFLQDCPAPPGPATFNLDILSKLKDLKVTGLPATLGVVDMTKHPDQNLIGVAVGPRFRGLIGALNRESYAAGGPWGDGPGRPEHLVGGGRRPLQRLEG